MERTLIDKCYNRTHQIGAKPYSTHKSKMTRYTAPIRILADLVEGNKVVYNLESKPIDPVLEDLLTKEYGNVLLHAFGAFHIAGACLAQGLRWQKDPSDDPNPSSDPTLASRLNYGSAPEDTLREEFCLAAFFQACLPHLPAAHQGKYSTVEEATIRSLLAGNKAYSQYEEDSENKIRKDLDNKIRTDIIAYWITGSTKVPDFIPKLPNENHNNHNFKMGPEEHILRIRQSYFSPEAPLSLVNLDICAKICACRSKKEFTEMREFLSRLRFGPDVRGAMHLMPGKTEYDLEKEKGNNPMPVSAVDWTDRFPYYMPKLGDAPPYVYLEAFLDALVYLKRSLPSLNPEDFHPIFKAFQSADKLKSKPTGFLRLSLLQIDPTNDEAPSFQAKILETLTLDS